MSHPADSAICSPDSEHRGKPRPHDQEAANREAGRVVYRPGFMARFSPAMIHEARRRTGDGRIASGGDRVYTSDLRA